MIYVPYDDDKDSSSPLPTSIHPLSAVYRVIVELDVPRSEVVLGLVRLNHCELSGGGPISRDIENSESSALVSPQVIVVG